MKILLIQPAKAPDTIGSEEIFFYEPLALEYLASALLSDHEVQIVDLRLDNNLKKTFDEFNPDIVGITAYTVNVNTVKGLFKLVKTWKPEIYTVVGGHHATVSPSDFIESCIDLIIVGEGVLVFKEIVRRLERKTSFEGIRGIAYSRNGGIIKSDHLPVQDLDGLPFPSRELTEKYRKNYFSEWRKPIASIRTSQGCPFSCNFCALWKINGGRYLTRRPENIVKELSGIKEEHIFFADDESLVDHRRMLKLADLIRDSGIRKHYFLYGRSDTIVRHPEVIEKWREIGLERIFIGLEFFRDEDLADINKKSTTVENEEAVRILKHLDIKIYGSFIIRPGFTKDDFREFKKYSLNLRLDLPIFSVLTPLPGTDLWEEARDKLITHNYDYFDLLHTVLPTRLSPKEFYEEFYHLYKNSASLSSRLFSLMNYSPGEIIKAMKMLHRIRNAYRSVPE